MQEWQEEEDQQAFAEALSALCHITQRCQQEDKDFWPSGIAATLQATHQRHAARQVQLAEEERTQQLQQLATEAAQAALPAAEAAQQGTAAATHSSGACSSTAAAQCLHGEAAETAEDVGYGAFWQSLGLVPLERLDMTSSPAEPAAPATATPASRAVEVAAETQTAQPPVQTVGVLAASDPAFMRDPYGQASSEQQRGEEGWASSTRRTWWQPPAAALAAAWAQLRATLAALSQPADAAATLRSGLAQGYAQRCRQLDEMVSAAAEALRSHGAAKLPWPQARLSRRSALRVRVEWHGVAWPERATKVGGLERVLDGL